MEKLHLTRIQVPNFRALKNIDITFEPYLVPRVFPIGSLNGGGKSTLLQLVFVLLYCSDSEKNVQYIRNMISGFAGEQTLAIIDFIIEDKVISLKFCSSQIVSDEDEVIYDGRYLIVCDYDEKESVFDSNELHRKYLVCQSHGLDFSEIQNYLNAIGEKIFLVAPITQPFRFIDLSIRELAFRQDATGEYHQGIRELSNDLPSFFGFDTVAIGLLLETFKAARDDDFRMAITSNGKYGNHYSMLLEAMQQVLGDKRVNIDLDFTGISFFKKDDQGDYSIKLYPEDLSHGELKRLSLFVWLKYNKIENSIVLMDEVEIALHPDWQYQIVQDLQNWAPSNQYILATHSYELCQALTPAHVKEISPHLLQK
jgi:AAA domain, putative AbiEii toxin, Type IV TA system